MVLHRSKQKAGFGFIALFLILALTLSACGEATATPVPTATPIPPTSTPVPPTATPVPPTATSVPTATTAASAAPGGGSGATGTTPGSTSATITLPTIAGAQEIPVDQTLVTQIAKQQGLSSAALKFYVSDDTPDKIGETADTTLTGNGYKFGLPGVDKPINQGGIVIGFYQKSGAPDILMAAADPSTFTGQFSIPGVSQDLIKQFTSQLNGKKSVLILIAAPDLLQALLGAASNITSTTPTTGGSSLATPTTGSSSLATATPIK